MQWAKNELMKITKRLFLWPRGVSPETGNHGNLWLVVPSCINVTRQSASLSCKRCTIISHIRVKYCCVFSVAVFHPFTWYSVSKKTGPLINDLWTCNTLHCCVHSCKLYVTQIWQLWILSTVLSEKYTSSVHKTLKTQVTFWSILKKAHLPLYGIH